MRDSGLVHTVRGTSGNVNDVVEANSLLHGQETDAFADAGYQGVDKRPDARSGVRWHVAMRPGLRRALDKDKPVDALIDQLVRTKARIRAKVEHPFRVLKPTCGWSGTSCWPWDRCAYDGRDAQEIGGMASPSRCLDSVWGPCRSRLYLTDERSSLPSDSCRPSLGVNRQEVVSR